MKIWLLFFPALIITSCLLVIGKKKWLKWLSLLLFLFYFFLFLYCCYELFIFTDGMTQVGVLFHLAFMGIFTSVYLILFLYCRGKNK